MPVGLRGGSCDDSTRLDSAQLGSMRDACASVGCMARGSLGAHRRGDVWVSGGSVWR
jgi:hypothetical protein